MRVQDLPEKSLQEIFDFVADHLLNQASQSLDSNDFCQFYSKDGSKCSFGILISPEDYSPEFEQLSYLEILNRIFEDFDIEVGEEFDSKKHLLETLINIHDHSQPYLWKDKLQSVASFLNLSPAILEKF